MESKKLVNRLVTLKEYRKYNPVTIMFNFLDSKKDNIEVEQCENNSRILKANILLK